jgi:hypothetical protein
MLSKQAVKIATKAEEHERFIFKVISPFPPPLPPLTISLLPFSFLARIVLSSEQILRRPCFRSSEFEGLLASVPVISPVCRQFWWAGHCVMQLCVEYERISAMVLPGGVRAEWDTGIL